jgi:hypothetical protein
MRLLADFVVVFHFLFIVFVVAGGLLVLRWPRVALVHVPSALWGLSTEFFGWWCPLTPLENWLRLRGGGTGYDVGFIEHYLLPVIYPANLTREVQIVMGSVVLALNLAIYFVVCFGRRSSRRQ